MEMNQFITHFAEQFEEMEVTDFTPETSFRDNDEWCSMLALSVMAMVDEEYDVQLTASEMRSAETIEDLYRIINSHLQ